MDNTQEVETETQKRAAADGLPAFLQKADAELLYAPLLNSLNRGTGKILEQDQQGMLLWEPAGHVLMVTHPDHEQMAVWLDHHLGDYPNCMIMSIGNGAGNSLKKHLPLNSSSPCWQFVWRRHEHPQDLSFQKPAVGLTLQPAAPDDLPKIASIYTLTSEEELQYALQHHNLFLLQNEKGSFVGFAGEHAEGSMGFLHIYPEYRRKGYAWAAEQLIIELEQKRNLIPYCHVFHPNLSSCALQRKLGLDESPMEVEWLWQEDSESCPD